MKTLHLLNIQYYIIQFKKVSLLPKISMKWYIFAFYSLSNAGLDETTELIVENGANVNSTDQDGWSALHVTALLRKFVFSLLQLGIRRNTGTSWINCYFLFIDDKVEIIKLLRKHGANINIQNSENSTPLHYAALRGKNYISKIWLIFRIINF